MRYREKLTPDHLSQCKAFPSPSTFEPSMTAKTTLAVALFHSTSACRRSGKGADEA